MPGRYWLLAGAVVLLSAGLVIQLVIYRSSGVNLGRFVLIIGNAALLFIASISLFLMELQRSRRIVRQIRRAKRRRTPGRSR